MSLPKTSSLGHLLPFVELRHLVLLALLLLCRQSRDLLAEGLDLLGLGCALSISVDLLHHVVCALTLGRQLVMSVADVRRPRFDDLARGAVVVQPSPLVEENFARIAASRRSAVRAVGRVRMQSLAVL